MAVRGGTGAATRSVFGSSPAAVGLCAVEETARGVSDLRKKAAKPTFVELVAAHPATMAECVIEFESTLGSKMRIQWKGASPPDWTGLLRAWREAER